MFIIPSEFPPQVNVLEAATRILNPVKCSAQINVCQKLKGTVLDISRASQFEKFVSCITFLS